MVKSFVLFIGRVSNLSRSDDLKSKRFMGGVRFQVI